MTNQRYIPNTSKKEITAFSKGRDAYVSKTIREAAPNSPISNKPMTLSYIGSNKSGERVIPVWVSLEDRVVYPVKE